MRRRIFSFAAAFLLFAFYCLCLPHFIQGGDTAELVTAARFKLVSHPPGYPLWIWLQHLWISVWPQGSVFFKASLLNAIFAMKALSALAMAPLGWMGFLPVLWLGLGHAFMESAILPDVFAFNALFVAAIGYFYLFRSEDDSLRSFLVPFYFALGLTNHLTLIALTPVVAHVLWTSKDNRRNRNMFIAGGLLGTILFFGLYLSILLLNTRHPLSWGNVKDLNAVWHHFLRSDYGTFSLTANDKNKFSFGPITDFFTRSLVWYLPLVIALLWSAKSNIWKERKTWVWISSLVFSIAFFFVFHIPTNGYGLEILIRFHVMPMVLLCFFMSYLLWNGRGGRFSHWLVLVFTLPILVQGVRQIPGLLSLSDDSVVEDYSRQLMKEAHEAQPSLMFVESDTAYGGLRYIQAGEYPDDHIGIAVYSLFFSEAFFDKMKLRLPEVSLSDSERIWSERKMKLADDLFKPNYDKISVFTMRPFKGSDEMKVTFYPLGRRLSPGKGIAFAPEEPAVLSKRYTGIPSGPQYFTRAYLYSQFAHYYLAKGMNFLEEKKPSEAVEQFEKALAIVPYAYPALIRICEITNSTVGRCEPSNIRSVRNLSDDLF
jgi:hypothetical protein